LARLGGNAPNKQGASYQGGIEVEVFCEERIALRYRTRAGATATAEANTLAVAAGPIRRRLNRELAVCTFLEALFRPRPQVFAPVEACISRSAASGFDVRPKFEI
jgi:hypothetical protein